MPTIKAISSRILWIWLLFNSIWSLSILFGLSKVYLIYLISISILSIYGTLFWILFMRDLFILFSLNNLSILDKTFSLIVFNSFLCYSVTGSTILTTDVRILFSKWSHSILYLIFIYWSCACSFNTGGQTFRESAF